MMFPTCSLEACELSGSIHLSHREGANWAISDSKIIIELNNITDCAAFRHDFERL